MFSNLIKRFIPSTTHIYLMILSNDQIIKIYLLCTLKKIREENMYSSIRMFINQEYIYLHVSCV